MELSLELMDEGSYQVESSDEGSMTDDIEACFRPVLKALARFSVTRMPFETFIDHMSDHACDLPAAELIAWCVEMLKADGGVRRDAQGRPRGIHLRSGAPDAATAIRGAAGILTRRSSPADDTGPSPRTFTGKTRSYE